MLGALEFGNATGKKAVGLQIRWCALSLRGLRLRKLSSHLRADLLPYGSRDLHFKAFGPKDHIIQGFRASLSIRVWVFL